MIVDVSTVLNCSAAKAWNRGFEKAHFCLRDFAVGAGRADRCSTPERWSEELTTVANRSSSGSFRSGVRTLHFEKIDHKNYELQSREHDPLIARWDHLVSIKPLDDTRAIYRDTIDVGAGSLTFVVWAWANWFYRHRQRRWRALAKTL